MSNKAKVIEVLKTSKPIVRTIMKDGQYKAQKVNDEYTILHETPAGWRQLSDGGKADSVIVLTDVQDRKDGMTRTIAVNGDFVNWPIKTNFVFRVESGKTKLILTPIPEKEMKELLKLDAA